MKDYVLYEKDRVKITYLHSPEPGEENKVISRGKHELWLKNRAGEWNKYIIQRGILKELSERSRGNTADMLDLLRRVAPETLRELGKRITLEDIKSAFLGAYQTEDERFKEYLAEQGRYNLEK